MDTAWLLVFVFGTLAWPLGYMLDNYVAPILGIVIGLIGLVALTILKLRNGAKRAMELIAGI